jgi:hypothetical protein
MIYASEEYVMQKNAEYNFILHTLKAVLENTFRTRSRSSASNTRDGSVLNWTWSLANGFGATELMLTVRREQSLR